MKKIYLIDDDDIYVFLTKKTILNLNDSVDVEVFSDGLKAISHIRKVKDDPDALPDIIFLDLNMPVMDGWAFLEEYEKFFHELARKNRLYIVSSSISPYDLEKSREFSAVTEFIVKPLVKEKFLQIISG